MKKTLLILVCFLTGPALPVRADVINILTTTTDLRSIAEYIGGSRVRADSLGKGNQNYHFLEAKPSYMIKAKKADLFIVNGLDLEIGYASLILEGSRNHAIQMGRPGYLDASEEITALEVPVKVDRSMGDVHPGGNPHYMLDPSNAKIVASTIAQRLSEISSEDATYFQSNLAAFHRKIDEKMGEWKDRLAPFKGRKIAVYHRSWTYFVSAFGLEVACELESKPGIAPSPRHLKKVIDTIKENNIPLILMEVFYDTKPARFVAQSTGAVVVVVPNSVGGTQGADDYISLMGIIVDSLAEAMP